MLILVVAFAFVLIDGHFSDSIGYSKQSYCLDELPTNKLFLECPEKNLIKLGRIVYGFSWSSDCSYIDKDCTMEVPRDDILCQSPSNCTVRVVQHPLILQGCWNLPASYVQAEFECIENFVLQNICQKQETELSHGFLSSPSYPLGSSANQFCQCVLSPSSNHSIALEIIDFRLPSCAEAGLYLSITEDLRPKCSNQNPITLLANQQQNVTLRFYTFNTFSQGGFLLKYSILPLHTNGTVRLQCHFISTISRSLLSKQNFQSSTFPSTTESILDLEQLEDLMLSSTIYPDLKQLSNSKIPAFQLNKNVYPSARFSLQQVQSLLASSNQTSPNKQSSAETPTMSVTTMALFILCITAGIIFCLIIINFFVWIVCTSRSLSSKKDLSRQNLYSRPKPLPSNVSSHRTSPPPSVLPGNKLKTLHSLLYLDRRQTETDSTVGSSKGDSQKNHSEWEQTLTRTQHHNERTITFCSTPTNLTHGFFVKSKFDSTLKPIEQINSWDDV